MPDTQTAPDLASWLLDAIYCAVSEKGVMPDRLLGRKRPSKPTLTEVGTLHRMAINALGDEFLALPCSGDVPSGTFKLMCQSMLGAATVGAAMKRGIAFHHILHGLNFGPALRISDDKVGIGFEPLCSDARVAGSNKLQEEIFGLLIWHGFLNWLSGYRLQLEHIDIAGPEQVLPSALTEHFVVPICFHAPQSQLVALPSCLDLPVLKTEADLSPLLRNYPESMLSPSSSAVTLSHRILKLFGMRTTDVIPTVEEIAGMMNLSVSTLHRRLRGEKTSIQDLKDQYRWTLVRRLLADQSLTLSDIAVSTGFAEQSSFFRSFRRWTGMTPNEFRKQIE